MRPTRRGRALRALGNRIGLAASLLFPLAACEDSMTRATVIDPSFGDPCRYAECGGNGECAEAAAGGPMCVCDVGYAGARCDACQAGFHLDFNQHCVPDRSCAEQQTNVCGLHGSCDDADGVVACYCDPGYEGPRCTLCQSGYGRDAFGDCVLERLGGDDPAPTGSEDDPGEGPESESNPCVAESCEGHGQCDGSSGLVECSCATGYSGANCGSCAAGYRRDLRDECVPIETCAANSCGAHGSCDDGTGVIVCTCELGFGGSRCEGCAPGFHDEAGACVLDQQCLPTTCAGHGGCSMADGNTQCACNAGYAGSNCESCAPGHHRDPSGGCAVNETCSPTACGAYGDCNDSTGALLCACDPGYSGVRCSECSFGFHRIGDGTCALDEQCQPHSCPEHSTCDDSTGVVACACEAGHDGESCSACAPGYVRDHARDLCALIDCESNPIEGEAQVTFEDLGGFPTYDNNCVNGAGLALPGLELRSIAGDGDIWACARSTLYGLQTRHVFIEAGSMGPAELRFAGPIATLSFDYGARSELSLQILADGEVVRTVSATRRSSDTLSFTFDAPITVLALRSVGGATNQIALDNVAYAPPPCD